MLTFVTKEAFLGHVRQTFPHARLIFDGTHGVPDAVVLVIGLVADNGVRYSYAKVLEYKDFVGTAVPGGYERLVEEIAAYGESRSARMIP